jgi:putative glutamine amidotransferase
MKIGITENRKYHNYFDWMEGAGDVEVVKLSVDSHENVEDCDGIVLSGGIDLHPKYYKASIHYPGAPDKGFETNRDEFEFAVLEKCLKNSIPLLGICRGLQLINVFFKGTLIQDLGSKNVIHESNGDDRKHNVKVEEGTILHDIVQVNSGTVNSAHHQAIDKLGENLVVNSYSEDGVIEGIEWKNKNNGFFMLAVQWHPERMSKSELTDSPLTKNIRDHFISVVKSNKKK